MKVISKQVYTNKSLCNDEIEQELSQYGEPLRWAVVDVKNDFYIIEAVFV